MLTKLGIASAGLVAALAIAACGGDDNVGGVEDVDAPVAESGPVEGEFTVSNWPGYIDTGKDGSVAEFEERYPDVEVKYIEDVNSNVTFLGKMRPLLEEGESGGRDIFVVTDWMAARMYSRGYLQEFDQEAIQPALDNLEEQFDPEEAYDPDHKFSIPWQGGMTGIWVNTSEADEITSINDLFDPKYKGRVTMLDELRDTVPLVMRAQGVDMEDATKEDWLAAIEKISDAADSGQIRRFTGNDYTEDMTSGNAVAAIGWSGDAYLIGRDDVEWRRPEEGCNLWFDTAVIPVGAPNTAAALEFINFAYEPEVQADIAAFVNYVTPVAGVREILAERKGNLDEDPLIFPDDEFIADCVPFTEPPGDPEDVAEVEEAFQEVVSG
jgi:spermidine/putrescine transport system substrate-binding protein